MRFALIAHPRSGTTLFRQLLNNNPKVYCFGEVLYPGLFSWGFFQHLEIASASNPRLRLQTEWQGQLERYFEQIDGLMIEAGKKHIGYDLKIPHIAAFFNFFSYLYKKKVAVVHLIRRDRVSLVCSIENMRWRADNSVPVHDSVLHSQPKIHLDPKWLQSRVEWLNAQDKRFSIDSKNLKYTQIFYEDLVDENLRGEVEKQLSEFIGDTVSLSGPAKNVKQSSWNLEDKIKNFDVIKPLLPVLNQKWI